MANLWHDISRGDNIPEEFTTIIEVVRGSLNKYEVEKETGMIALDRVLHTAQPFPFDYGFVPQTLWEDGDPLDVIVMTTEPLHPGILINVRPVGIMDMTDSGDGDSKLITVPVKDPRFNDVQDIDDVNEHFKKTWKHFYETYKMLQGKVVTVHGYRGKKEAIETFKKGVKLYEDKFKK